MSFGVLNYYTSQVSIKGFFMPSKQVSIISLFILLLAAFLFFTDEKNKQTVVELIRPVRITEVLLAPKAIKLRFSGTTQAVDTFNISFRVPGNIIEFAAQVGTPLEQGELIARLDS